MELQRLTLSIEEAANVLGISRALAYELVRRGELPSLRLGRRVVVPRRSLEALVEGHDDEDSREIPTMAVQPPSPSVAKPASNQWTPRGNRRPLPRDWIGTSAS